MGDLLFRLTSRRICGKCGPRRSKLGKIGDGTSRVSLTSRPEDHQSLRPTNQEIQKQAPILEGIFEICSVHRVQKDLLQVKVHPKITKRAFERASKLFPFDLQLWEIGAYYYLEILQNPLQARNLMLKALALMPEQPKLWTTLLFLEIRIQLLVFQRENLAKSVLRAQDNDKKIIQESNHLELGIIESEPEEKKDEGKIIEEEEKQDEGFLFISFNLIDSDSESILEFEQDVSEEENELANVQFEPGVDFEWIVQEMMSKFGQRADILEGICEKFSLRVSQLVNEVEEENQRQFVLGCKKNIFTKLIGTNDIAEEENNQIKGI